MNEVSSVYDSFVCDPTQLIEENVFEAWTRGIKGKQKSKLN
jgi:hypothetical protein